MTRSKNSVLENSRIQVTVSPSQGQSKVRFSNVLMVLFENACSENCSTPRLCIIKKPLGKVTGRANLKVLERREGVRVSLFCRSFSSHGSTVAPASCPLKLPCSAQTLNILEATRMQIICTWAMCFQLTGFPHKFHTARIVMQMECKWTILGEIKDIGHPCGVRKAESITEMFKQSAIASNPLVCTEIKRSRVWSFII